MSETKPNAELCLCGYCPTFKVSPLTGSVFCVRGAAKGEVKKFGCVCEACSIYMEYGLRDDYLCVSGKSI